MLSLTLLLTVDRACPDFVALKVVNGRERLTFLASQDSKEALLADPGENVILDFALISRQGQVAVSGPLGLTMMHPSGRITELSSHGGTLILGASESHRPVTLLTTQTHVAALEWCGHNNFTEVARAKYLQELLQHVWWHGRLPSGNLAESGQVGRLAGPAMQTGSVYTRTKWISAITNTAVFWEDSSKSIKFVKGGREYLVTSPGSGATLRAISGNQQYATVSIVYFSAAPKGVSPHGSRVRWTDAGSPGAVREVYVSFIIDLREGKVLKSVNGAARVEVLRSIPSLRSERMMEKNARLYS